MFASRHVVFAGPGRLPRELRDLLLKRQGAPQSDLAVQPSRLVSFFDSAAEAEKVAGQLQRLKIAAVVAGPEQLPAEAGWLLVEELELDADRVRVTTANQEHRDFTPADLKTLTVVDWRPEEGQADRAALLRLKDFHRPLYFRALRLRTGAPHEGLRLLTALIDRCQAALPVEAVSRQRKLSPEAVGAPTLSGDLLPLGLAFVDALQPPSSHSPLEVLGPEPAPAPPQALALPFFQSRGAALWATGAVLSTPMTLGLLLVGLAQGRLLPVVTGLGMTLWSTRRYLWSRWLRHHASLRERLAGLRPARWDPALEAALAALWVALARDPFFSPIALPMAGIFAVLLGASALTALKPPPGST